MNPPSIKAQTEVAAATVREVLIDAEMAGQRIDNFLLARLKGAPRSLVYRLLRTGQVRVNKGRIKPVYRLAAGDVVRIPPVRLGESDSEERPGNRLLERLEACIIHEDDDFIALDKPAGIAVHGGSGVNHGVIEALRTLRPNQRTLELVHRLDRETSGCLLVAKRRSALRQIHELMRRSQVEKRYYALCMGRWRGGGRRVDAPLHKNVLQSGERVVRVSQAGKEAISIFIPVRRFVQATLMEVVLETGRTHQIRVHSAHAGHPIAGDEKYGDAAFNKAMKAAGLCRMFLHAHHLSFDWDGNRIEIEAPLDDELEEVLAHLPAKESK